MSSSPGVEMHESSQTSELPELPDECDEYIIKAIKIKCYIGCEKDGSLCFEEKIKDNESKLKWRITFREDGTCWISKYVLHIHLTI